MLRDDQGHAYMSPRKICTAVTHGSKKSIITLANVFLFDLFRSN